LRETLGAGLKGVPAAGRIGLGRCRLAQQRAEVVEVRLRRRALLERGVAPLGDELLGERVIKVRSSSPPVETGI